MHGNSSRSNELAACSSDQQRQKQQLCQKSIKKTFGAEKLVIFIPSTTSMTYIRMTVLPIFFWKVVVGKIAIEIDDEASHNTSVISRNMFYDDLMKQNSMVYLG